MRGRSKTRSSLTLIGHDTAEEVTRAMPHCWRRWLRWTAMMRRTSHMGRQGRATSGFKLVAQKSDFVLIPMLTVSSCT